MLAKNSHRALRDVYGQSVLRATLLKSTCLYGLLGTRPPVSPRQRHKRSQRRQRVYCKTTLFLDAYAALCRQYHMHIEGTGYECDGEAVRTRFDPSAFNAHMTNLRQGIQDQL